MTRPEDEAPVVTHASMAVAGTAPVERVQCPICCRLAPVTGRSMGLVSYRCDLCLTVGALPDPRMEQ